MKTLESFPENSAHWSSCGVAKASGPPVFGVQRIWRAKPLRSTSSADDILQLIERFCLCNAPANP